MFRDFLRVPPAAVASAADLGTWVRLYVCAAEIEKGGRLAGAGDWADRQWLAFAQVTRAEVAGAIAAGLIVPEDRDMIVVGYDLAGEKRVQTVRENGRRPTAEGKRRGRKPKTSAKPGDNPGENQTENQGETDGKPERNPSSYSGSDPHSASPSRSVTAPSDPRALYPRSAELRRTDPQHWRELVEIHGLRQKQEPAQHQAMEQILAARAAS